MDARIRVRGKSQSRTALGIINAYIQLHPDATPDQVMQAFPKALNRRCPADNLIIPVEETAGHEKMFFEQDDELVVFKSGKKYSLVEVWGKEDFEAICEHAKQYGIVASKKKAKPFEKGSFELESLDGGEGKKKCKYKWLWWVVLAIILLLLLLLLCRKCCSGDKCSTPAVDTVVNVANEPSDTTAVNAANSLISDVGDAITVTLPDGSTLNIPKNSKEFELFSSLNDPNAQVESDPAKGWITLDKVRFETGSSNPTPGSDAQLKSVAQMMMFFPKVCLKIGGYTDNTGNDAVNMRVSAGRAKAVVAKLVSMGVAADRVTSEGYGSARPVCPPNDTDDCRAANRRVDVKVTQK